MKSDFTGVELVLADGNNGEEPFTVVRRWKNGDVHPNDVYVVPGTKLAVDCTAECFSYENR